MCITALMAVLAACDPVGIEDIHADENKGNSSTDRLYVYVKDGSGGSGLTPDTAFKTLADAYGKIGENNGTIVVCGPLTVNALFTAPAHSGNITVTSAEPFDGGTRDFRKRGAYINFSENFACGGETLIENIDLVISKSDRGFFGCGHKLTLGNGIASTFGGTNKAYYCVIGGTNTSAAYSSAEIIINSGEWARVRGGSSTSASASGAHISIKIYGGTIYERLTLGGSRTVTGTVEADIYGGNFYGCIYGTENAVLNETVNLRIHGGTFYGEIAPAMTKANNNQNISGEWNVSLNGGNLAHITDLRGTDGFRGTAAGASTLKTGTFNPDADMTGKYTFTNPLRTGADPWVFFHDGYYYLAVTGGSSVALSKAANLSDLGRVAAKTIYSPASGQIYSTPMWSPEIHYFTEAQAGTGNDGWYMFINSGDGSGVGSQVTWVVKCLTDDLLGQWGHPVSKTANVPIQASSSDDPALNAIGQGMSGGYSVLKVRDKTYITWVGEVNRGSPPPDFHQVIYINEMITPWLLKGVKQEICVSEYSWEKGGSTDGVHPMVVEGSTAVYGDNGEVFIIYSGSGYWTTLYSLGQLKLKDGADPLIKASWQKKSTPIFQKSGTVNGCGHASYVRDTSGSRWICYHAYIGTNTSSGRYVFIEPYTINKSGDVVIGRGNQQPAPLDTEYTVDVNPMPLRKRISGFGTVSP